MAYGSWVKVYTSLPSHLKTLRLAELLGTDIPKTIGHLVCLWLWSLDNAASDGLLEGATPLAISRAAQWERDPADFVDGLLNARFLECEGEDYRLRNWAEYGGQLVKSRERDRRRKENWKRSDGVPLEVQEDSDGIPEEIQGNSTGNFRKRREEKRREEEPNTYTKRTVVRTVASDEAISAAEKVPYKELMELWNSTIGSKGRPSIRGLTDQRKGKIKRLWRNQGENGDFSRLETWKRFFEYILEKCPFLMGGTWNFCFDWILSPSNFQKIIEGNYEEQKAVAGQTQWNRRA